MRSHAPKKAYKSLIVSPKPVLSQSDVGVGGGLATAATSSIVGANDDDDDDDDDNNSDVDNEQTKMC